jgi:mono/diheme cytochrome c family protein
MKANLIIRTLAGLFIMITLISKADEMPELANTELIDLGLGVYQQQCASCHGATGEGALNWKEPNDSGELPAPPHGPKGHTWRHSDGMLYRMISRGWRDPFNKTQMLTMPAFGGVLTPIEINAVIAYLKTHWTLTQRQFQSAETLKH